MIKKLKASALTALIFLSALLSLPCPSSAQGFALKLFGGYDYLKGGDVKDGMKGGLDYYTGLMPLSGFIARQEYNAPQYAWDAGGDLIFYFSPAIGLGIGAGYIQTLAAKSNIVFTKPLTDTITMTMDPKITAVPIRASLYIAIPLGSAITLSLHGGAAYYLAKMQFVWRQADSSHWEQAEFKTNGKGLGFQGGLGLEINLGSSLALVLEGTGQLANIGGFSGTKKETSNTGSSNSESGKIYFFKYNYGALGIFPEVDIRDAAPSGSAYSEVREAKVDFSGFAARTGFIFRF